MVPGMQLSTSTGALIIPGRQLSTFIGALIILGRQLSGAVVIHCTCGYERNELLGTQCIWAVTLQSTCGIGIFLLQCQPHRYTKQFG